MSLLSNEALAATLERIFARDRADYRVENAIESADERSAYLARAVALLDSPSWTRRNLGVKLVGLLQARCERSRLVAVLADRTPARWYERLAGGDFRQVGFIRRNALTALVRLGEVTPDVEAVVIAALADPYFEARTEAAHAIGELGRRFSEEGRRRAVEGLRRAVGDQWLEVASTAAVVLGLVGSGGEAVPILLDLGRHRYWMVRSGALEGLLALVERGEVADLEALEASVREFVLAATDFRPEFPIKTTYADLVQAIRRQKGPAA